MLQISPTIFGKKKFEQGIRKKKLSTQAKIFEKMNDTIGNGHPPHQFSNGPSLSFKYRQWIGIARVH
jgi:hypothetical protein